MRDPMEPLFSLSSGHGAGTLLGAAAGDVLGGTERNGYSAYLQQAIVVSYHLMRHGEVIPELLVAELVDLSGDDELRAVYRQPSPDFRRWLLAAATGQGERSVQASHEPALRAFPLGLWYRREPESLVRAGLAVAGLTNRDAPSALAAVAMAGGVAASAVAQSGPDLLLAAAEMCDLAMPFLDHDAVEVEEGKALSRRLRTAVGLIGEAPLEIRTALSGERMAGIDQVLVALVGAAPVGPEPFRLLEDAALLGGSSLGAMVGAMVGARVGLRQWPLTIPSDTWFAEIGRRMAVKSRVFEDLPIPYHAEEYITYGPEGRDRFGL